MINIDADGFLVDWQGYVIEHHFPELTIEELNQMDSDVRHHLLREMYNNDPQLFYKLEPMPGAREFMQFIMDLGEPWRVLTSAGSDHPDFKLAEESKRQNLKKHFGIPRENIIVCPESSSKSLYAEHKDDILIDDYFLNIEQWKEAGSVGILFSKRSGLGPVKDAVLEACHQEAVEDLL